MADAVDSLPASAPVSAPLLSVEVRGRRFSTAEGGSLHAIGELAFDLQPGSFTCIVGPSGCGKTTTLRMILGLDTGFQGEIRLGVPGQVAAVFQEPRLLPWRTVEQNVRLALPSVRQGANLDDLFMSLGLAAHRDFLPGELSLGLARRVALARAFALEPRLILLDEPFVSLDGPTAERLRALLVDLFDARPTTALMVTHDLDEAVSLAERVLVFGAAPARIVGSVDIDVPRHARTPQLRSSWVDQLHRIAAEH